jgi:m7GpppX diphosphatase
MTSTTPPEIASKVEALIPRFKLTRLLNSDQAGRRISLYGTIESQPALFIAERAAFDTSEPNLTSFSTSLRNIKNLGANDIYSWFLANSNPSNDQPPPDFKLNLIYPCTEKHVKKYEAQGLRVVTETPSIYSSYIRPYMAAQREKGALNWVFNIIEGRTEQEDVMYRESDPNKGFLLLPDLNWDRKTIGALHLLGLVERRDIWSVRDLKKGDVVWLKHMKDKMVEATCGLYPDVERDQLKLYVHCEPIPSITFRNLSYVFQELIVNRSTNVLPLPHSHRARRAGSGQYTSHRQGIGSGKHHLPARDDGRRRRRWDARRKLNLSSRRTKRLVGESISTA